MTVEANNHITILLVDDTPGTIGVVQAGLEGAGYRVAIATSGEKALQRAELVMPDLILLDVMMQGMDGYETCRRLKEQECTREIPVIFLSALSDTFDKVKGFGLGAVDYLIKPIAAEELLARVRTHVTISRLEREFRAANETLEEKVAERTDDLQQANEELRKNAQQIQSLLCEAESSRSALLSILEDEKMAQEAQRRLNRELQAISNCNQALMRAEDEQTLLNEVCRIICDEAGYRLAWVGYAERDTEKTVHPVAWGGYDSGYVADAKLSWSDETDRGRGPEGSAIRSGEVVYIQDFSTDPCMAPWRENALQRGYHSAIALPLKNEDADVFGVLSIYSVEPNAFTPDELRILKEMSGDLAFGITVLRTRAERKRAEEALFEAQEVFRALVENSPDIIVRYNRECKRTYINPACLREVNIPYEEVIGAAPMQRSPLPAASATILQSLLRRVLDSGVAEAVDVLWPRADNPDRCYNMYAFPELDREGRVASVMTIARDITTRKRAEAALQKSEALLNATQRLSKVGGWEFDVASGQFFWTDQLYRIHEIPDDPSIDHLQESLKCYRLEDRPIIQEAFRRAVEEGVAYDLEFPFTTYQGNALWIRTNAQPVYENDKIVRLIGNIMDITDRKRADEDIRRMNERFTLAAHAARLGVWDWDIQKNELLWDDRMYALYGLRKEDFAGAYEAWLQGLHPDDRALCDEVSRLARIGEAEYDTEFRVVWPDGSIHYLKAYGLVVRDTDGNALRMTGVNFDITERKQAEEERLANLRFFENMDRINRAIQETNDFEQMLSNTLDVTLSIFDCDRAFLTYPLDPEAATWSVPMERTKPEYPGANVLGLEMPIDPDLARTYREVLASERPVKFGPETKHPLPKEVAERFNFLSYMSIAIYPKLGKPWQFGIHQCSYARVWTSSEEKMLQEIGRRLSDGLSSLLAHRDLQASEAKYRSIIETSSEGIWFLGPDTLTVFVNPQMTEMLGYSCEEMIGHPVTDFMFEEDLPDHYQKMKNRQSGMSEHYERRYRHKNGREIWTLASAVPIQDEAKNFQGAFGMFTDITERKKVEVALCESEAKTRSILDNIGIGVALVSPQMEILELNRRMREWFPAINLGRHSHCCQMLGEPLPDGPCDYCPTSRTLLDRLIHEITRQIPQAGIDHTYRIVSFPVFNAADEVTAAIELVEDITEKLSLESQLQQSQKMEAVGRLAGGVAHDFNNMLSVILGHAEIALDQVDPTQPLHADLEQIRKAAERSADLTRQLLAFARKQTVVPKVLNINETVTGMLRMLERLIGENMNLIWQPGQNLWPVKVDPSQIDQILANLCVNARDAIADIGQITIKTENSILDEDYCAAHTDYVPGEYVKLAVSDTGCGMDRETQLHIFEPFFTTKEMGKGTGLGLATVYGIVKQNNGFLDVYSEPGQGTTFWINLPRHMGEVEQQRKNGVALPAGRGYETILLVEDESAILKLTTMQLERQGYTVLASNTPGEAIRLAREYIGQIHLLMTDIVMPEMSGQDLAQRLGSFNPDLKCLFMSGYTADIIAHHGVVNEGVFFIQKPFSQRDLAVRVREALNSEYGKAIDGECGN